MAFTRHGHHIPGTVLTDSNSPPKLFRCGGPRICKQCALEATGVITDEGMGFQTQAKRAVVEYFNDRVMKEWHSSTAGTHIPIAEEDVYVVWWSKVLQNWKAMAITTRSDGMYYELTYNGDKKELYLDAYKKIENKVLYPDPSPGE